MEDADGDVRMSKAVSLWGWEGLPEDCKVPDKLKIEN